MAAAPASAQTARIRFATPSVVDPIHSAGEPSVEVDAAAGRIFASGPTGTGTQRSLWETSVDGGHTFRLVSPGPTPSAIQGLNAPPGDGDTDYWIVPEVQAAFGPLPAERAGFEFFALTERREGGTGDPSGGSRRSSGGSLQSRRSAGTPPRAGTTVVPARSRTKRHERDVSRKRRRRD